MSKVSSKQEYKNDLHKQQFHLYQINKLQYKKIGSTSFLTPKGGEVKISFKVENFVPPL